MCSTHIRTYVLALFALIGHVSAANALSQPKNIILVIGDGMGFAQVEAGRIYNGDKKLVFENFPALGQVTTHNALHTVTDSAAGATALATGHKVLNAVLSVQIPGDKKPLVTILELAKKEHKSTGLVTTAPLSDATPAGFAAHTDKRSNTADILADYVKRTQPNIIFGADQVYYRDLFKNAVPPYDIVTTLTQLNAIEQNPKGHTHVYGGFGQHPLYGAYLGKPYAQPLEITPIEYYKANDLPHLSDMTQTALNVLSQNKNGFFLMVESGLIDLIGHQNGVFPVDSAYEATRAMGIELAELNRVMTLLKNWVDKNPDSILVLTADHETGGLVIERGKTSCIGQIKCVAASQWTSGSEHTGANVPIYAYGKNAHLFAGVLDNTEIPQKLRATSTY